jgi:hypothetical protein
MQSVKLRKICIIDFCRLLLQVHTVADIASAEGKHLNLCFMKGHVSLSTCNQRETHVNAYVPKKRGMSGEKRSHSVVTLIPARRSMEVSQVSLFADLVLSFGPSHRSAPSTSLRGFFNPTALLQSNSSLPLPHSPTDALEFRLGSPRQPGDAFE